MLLAVFALVAAPAHGAGSHIVRIKDIDFHPATLVVHRGDRVTWRFLDHEVPHNVTSVGKRRFRSSDSKTSGTYSLRFTRPGTYRYVCTIHANMHGEIDVREGLPHDKEEVPTMSSPDTLALERFDVDGALQETGAALDDGTRAAFFKKAGVAAASLAGTGALMGGLPSLAMAAKGLPKSDVAILNFALTLEYLEAEFYKQASSNVRSGALGAFAALVAEHEATHVKTLKKVLGSKAVKKPSFDFGDTVTDPSKFAATAFVLENTGVHAYLGQAGKIKTGAILAAAATIVTVEARHASAIALITDPNAVAGKKGITPDGSFDVPKSKSAILKAVKATGFIKG